MIVFSAIVPHSPLLIPSVGKERHDQLAQTLQAYDEIEHALYVSRPDSLVIISPHAACYPDAFSGNLASHFTGVLKEFGDHGTKAEARVDFLLLDHIHRGMRGANLPFTLTSQEELDYGFTVPLLLLCAHLPKLKLVPLSPARLDIKTQVEFGRELKNILSLENQRIALVASADLSHHANTVGTQTATAEGQWFDASIREKITQQDLAGLMAMDAEQCARAEQCGFAPIAILMGALEGVNHTTHELCYEAPFGVGYSTVLFDLA